MASMSRKERAKYYLVQLKDEPTERKAKQIGQSINKLVYSESKNALSYQEKMAIVEEMENQIGSQPILEHADNTAILDLISLVKSIVKENK